MARIRTIKPDFWTDDKLTECSMSARLLFIGLLNFADDNGNLARSAKKIKMQVFPADAVDCEPMLQELMAQGALIEYSVNEEKFLHIKGFRKHQVINRPTSSGIPQPSFMDDSVSNHGALQEGREGKGMEDKRAKALSSPAKPPTCPPCPIDRVVEVYHELLPELPAVRLKTDARSKAIRKFWGWVLTSKKPDGARRAETADQALAWLADYFGRVRDNDFLMGKTPKSGEHAGWKCDLDYLLTERGMKQVIEKTGVA